MKTADIVKAALDAGKKTFEEAQPWIAEHHRVKITPQVFGRMLLFIKRREEGHVRTRPKRGKYNKSTPKPNWEVNREVYIQKKIALAKTIKELLKDHLPAEIEEMVVVLAATS